MSADGAGSISGQRVFFYAQYLGVDLNVHPDLKWLVDAALSAPLPGDWVKDRRGEQVFYHNTRTKVSTWAHPLEQVHKDIGGKIMRARSCNLSDGERALECDHMQRKYAKMASELQAVVGIKEGGERKFRNQVTTRVSTTDPRPAISHVMNLYEQAMTVINEQPSQSHQQWPTAASSIQHLRPTAAAAAVSGTSCFSGSSGLSRRALQRSASEILRPAMGARTRAKYREELPSLKPNLVTRTTDHDPRDRDHVVLKAMSCVCLEPIDLAEEAELLE